MKMRSVACSNKGFFKKNFFIHQVRPNYKPQSPASKQVGYSVTAPGQRSEILQFLLQKELI